MVNRRYDKSNSQKNEMFRLYNLFSPLMLLFFRWFTLSCRVISKGHERMLQIIIECLCHSKRGLDRPEQKKKKEIKEKKKQKKEEQTKTQLGAHLTL